MTISTAQITSQNMPTAEIARKQNMQRNHPLIQQFINKFNEQSMRHASSNTKNLSCPICHNSGHHVSNCPKFDICYKFNLVWEKEKAYCSSCEKRHVCMICEKEDHTAGGCPDRKKYCSDYNKKGNCDKIDCIYLHACKVCGQLGHSIKRCLLNYHNDFSQTVTSQSNICYNYNSSIGCKNEGHCNNLDICYLCHKYHPAYLCTYDYRAVVCYLYNTAFGQEKMKCKPEFCTYIHACFHCGSTDHSGRKCDQKNTKSCSNFNHISKGCNLGQSCQYVHRCKTCLFQDHPAYNCPLNFRPYNSKKVLEFTPGYQSVNSGYVPKGGGMQMSSQAVQSNTPNTSHHQGYDSVQLQSHPFGQYHPNPALGQSQPLSLNPNPHPLHPIISSPSSNTSSSRKRELPPTQMTSDVYQNPEKRPKIIENPLKTDNNMPQGTTSITVNNQSDGTLIDQMKYSIIINGVKWSGILTREGPE